ncbi:hypothetical protein F5884DRAFT_251279 [Xylogone sp. PMI_703]|nr:hypothetical protein F5884DRAFT_251279 [Xylogone sp. PMI_703]
MLSTRQISGFLTQKVIEPCHAILIAILDSRRYQPLSQDVLPTNRDINGQARKSHFHPPLKFRLWKLSAFIAGFFCLLVTLAVYLRSEGVPSTIHPAADLSRTNISKDEFVTAVLGDPIEGILDPVPIRRKCNETKFQEGLVWHCAAVNGGIGNVGNMWLNCVRYAMEAGATTLILPRLSARSDDLVDLGNEERSVELSYLYDTAYFFQSWKLVCPQMRAVMSDSEIPNLPLIDDSPHLYPQNVKKFKMRKYLIVDPTGWREAFDSWKIKNVAFSNMTAEKPVRLWQNLVLGQWNRETHSLEFARSFPRLFRYPIEPRELAASALWKLEKKIGRPVVSDAIILSSGSSTSSLANALGPNRLVSDGFLGAHLRVAADAAAAGWPGYDAQAPFYIAEAKRLNLSTIYLATGSPEHRDKFRKDAEREGLSVLVKEDLLDEDDLLKLQKLTWDQQAIVDFEVLMYSARFCGFVRSSFSWGLGLRRGTLPEAGTPTTTDKDEYRDNLSAIVGRHENINPEGLWP